MDKVWERKGNEEREKKKDREKLRYMEMEKGGMRVGRERERK